MCKYKIGVWGQFGDGGKIADGQAVRTTIITNELKDRYGTKDILVNNTNNWKKHPLIFLFNTIKLVFLCQKVVIFPADNGFKVGVPIIHIFNFFFKGFVVYYQCLRIATGKMRQANYLNSGKIYPIGRC